MMGMLFRQRRITSEPVHLTVPTQRRQRWRVSAYYWMSTPGPWSLGRKHMGPGSASLRAVFLKKKNQFHKGHVLGWVLFDIFSNSVPVYNNHTLFLFHWLSGQQSGLCAQMGSLQPNPLPHQQQHLKPTLNCCSFNFCKMTAGGNRILGQ